MTTLPLDPIGGRLERALNGVLATLLVLDVDRMWAGCRTVPVDRRAQR